MTYVINHKNICISLIFLVNFVYLQITRKVYRDHAELQQSYKTKNV